jgi:dipeptidase E
MFMAFSSWRHAAMHNLFEKNFVLNMNYTNRLFLMSMGIEGSQFLSFEQLVNKKPEEIKIAFIENAADIIPGADEWLPAMRQPWIDRGYSLAVIDLRKWASDRDEKGLSELLSIFDVIWVGGGHTYYLRWILKASGADEIIVRLIKSGKVYAGWSAGAVVAGPSIKYFDKMGDEPSAAPEQIYSGLGLMEEIIIPHFDHPDFAGGASATSKALQAEGYKIIELHDGEFFALPQVSDTSKHPV